MVSRLNTMLVILWYYYCIITSIISELYAIRKLVLLIAINAKYKDYISHLIAKRNHLNNNYNKRRNNTT